ncbi:MAG: hypothetical protein EOP04_29210 [Proteobacteria bacterium]|nr:MAG: hypothetical protein EOP04_29210 [Pseudomonadota bacterium]
MKKQRLEELMNNRDMFYESDLYLRCIALEDHLMASLREMDSFVRCEPLAELNKLSEELCVRHLKVISTAGKTWVLTLWPSKPDKTLGVDHVRSILPVLQHEFFEENKGIAHILAHSANKRDIGKQAVTGDADKVAKAAGMVIDRWDLWLKRFFDQLK